jgi:hypothetical protein
LISGHDVKLEDVGSDFFTYFYEWVVTYAKENPRRILWSAFGLMFTFAFYSHGWSFIDRIIVKLRIINNIGIRYFNGRESKAAREESWNDCVEKISSEANKSIMIMCSNGWETFGDEESPLHKVVDSFSGEMKILLLHPKMEALSIRAKNTGSGVDAKAAVSDYKENLYKTTKYCMKLKSQGRNIDLKFYWQYPTWKMVFSYDYLWLQHYADGMEVEDTPVYGFTLGDSKNSLYHPFYASFQKIWAISSVVDLSQSKTALRNKFFRVSGPMPSPACDGYDKVASLAQ